MQHAGRDWRQQDGFLPAWPKVPRGLPDQGADRLSDRGICVESSGKTAVDLSKDGLAIEPDGVIVTAADSDGEEAPAR